MKDQIHVGLFSSVVLCFSKCLIIIKLLKMNQQSQPLGCNITNNRINVRGNENNEGVGEESLKTIVSCFPKG